jgi:SnoaL-like domain
VGHRHKARRGLLVRMKAGAIASVASLAEAYLDAVSQGEGIAAAERYFHPDIVCIVNGPPVPVDGLALPSLSSELHSGLPWLGIYRGLDEVRAFLTHMHANLDVTGFGPREIVGDDERPVVFGWFGLRSRPDGREVQSAFSVLLEQRDRKIGRYQFLETPSTWRWPSGAVDRRRSKQTARQRPVRRPPRSAVPRRIQPARILPVPRHVDGPSRNITRRHRVLALRARRIAARLPGSPVESCFCRRR